MSYISLLSDMELLARIPAIVRAERIASADVVEHLMEVQRRHLYLEQASERRERGRIARNGAWQVAA
jgi:hypothetical protein